MANKLSSFDTVSLPDSEAGKTASAVAILKTTASGATANVNIALDGALLQQLFTNATEEQITAIKGILGID